MLNARIPDHRGIVDAGFQGAANIARNLSNFSYGRDVMIGLASVVLATIATPAVSTTVRQAAQVSMETLGSSSDTKIGLHAPEAPGNSRKGAILGLNT